ncbi:MAG: serine hydrolase domain-containing protein [Clostridia bacterium]
MRQAAARLLSCLLCAALLCAAVPCKPSHAQAAAVPADNEPLPFSAQLDRVLMQYNTMGACIAIIENGKITFTHCYGSGHAGGDAITEDTAFQVGSIGKMVANIGLMQLVEQNNLSLETELGTLLGFPIRNPNYPDSPITLRQLMTHTTGLCDHLCYQEALYGSPRPLDELFSGERLPTAFYRDHPPGEKREYTNFGGGLIGSLIEKLSDQPLDAYMNDKVFAPLQITAGYQAALLPPSLPMADMYQMPEKRLLKTLRKDPTKLTAADPLTHYFLTAGKLIISAPDLAKLLIVLCDGGVYQNTRLLKQSTVAQITALQNRIGSVACESNSGLFLNIITDDQVQGRTMYGHGGKANGMLCAAYFDPADRTGVVMLTNGCNNKPTHNGVGMLGRAVMRLCYQQFLNTSHVTEDPFLVE